MDYNHKNTAETTCWSVPPMRWPAIGLCAKDQTDLSQRLEAIRQEQHHRSRPTGGVMLLNIRRAADRAWSVVTQGRSAAYWTSLWWLDYSQWLPEDSDGTQTRTLRLDMAECRNAFG